MNTPITKEASAVQVHINILQGIISRMANNSANCKTWAITILSAILLLYADGKIEKTDLWVCYIPMCLFFFLDCYYLGLERQIIKKQSEFVTKINNGINVVNDIYIVNYHSEGNLYDQAKRSIKTFFKQFCNTVCAILSFSTLPFYGLIICFVYYLEK